MAKPPGMKLTKPAGKIAANASVPKLGMRATIDLSTNCITVKDMVVTTIGAANFSIYLSEVGSSPSLDESRNDLSVILRHSLNKSPVTTFVIARPAE
jgi:hypothetical protein